jgi:FtsZ-interacting cell division protein ZipA
MEELLYKLLEQTPLVIILVLVVWTQQKEKKELKEDYKTIVKSSEESLLKLSDSNTIEVKELNETARNRDNSTIEAINENSNALAALYSIVKEVKDDLK